MTKNKEKLSQILEKQLRKYNNNKDVAYIIKKLNVISDIESIYLGFMCSIEDGTELDIDEKEMNEWIKYSPVASFSCLELYVKSIYSRLIDKGAPYTENIEQLNINFNLKDFFDIKKENITIGDFSSHVIPASNFINITKNIGFLIGLNFIKELKEKHKEKNYLFADMVALDKYIENKEIESFEIIKEEESEKNAGEFIKNIKGLIDLRNIICHENTYNTEDNEFSCENSSRIVKEFIYLTEEIINNIK